MSTNLRRPTFWLALLSAVLILTLGVAACARLSQAGPGPAPLPTIVPTTQPGQPTLVPPAPTTAQPGQPTLVPTVQPTLVPTVQPTLVPTVPAGSAEEGALKVVAAMLDAYVAGGDVLPFLTSATRDKITSGAYSLQYLLALKPMGGQSYTLGQPFVVQGVDAIQVPAAINHGGYVSEYRFTVVWDGAQRVGGGVLASDPTPAPYPQSTQELITRALDETFRGGDARPYLSQQLVEAINGGRSPYDALGLRLEDANGYVFGEQYGYPGADISLVPVTINYYSGAEQRIFTVAIDHAGTPPQARIYGSELAREDRPVATSPKDAATRFLTEIWAERSGRLAQPYLYGELRERVARGEPVDVLADGGVGPLTPLSGFEVREVVAEDATYRWVEVSLNLDGTITTRFVKTLQVEGFWRVAAVVSSLAGEPPPAFPGAGWTAWKSGDFNGDGFEETVYLKETSAVNNDRLSDPLLNSDSLNATAVMVVQRGPQNAYAILEIDSRSARGADGYSMPFTSAESPDGPAFFQVAVTYAYEGRFLHLMPLKADGYAYAQAMAFKWHPDFGGYRLIGGPFGEW